MTSGGCGAIAGITIFTALASPAVDTVLLELEMRFQQNQLGIDNDYLTKQATRISVDTRELIERIRSSLKIMAIKFLENFQQMPAGLVVTMETISGKMLNIMLDMMIEDQKGMVLKRGTFHALMNTITAPLTGMEIGFSIIPIFGALIAGIVSGTSTYLSLHAMLATNVAIAKSCISVIKDMAAESMKGA